LTCVLPAVYYDDVGYSSDEIDTLRAYAYNPNPSYDVTVRLYAATTSDLEAAYQTSCTIGDNLSDMGYCGFSSPSLDWAEAYVVLTVDLPPRYLSGTYYYSKFYGIRVHHDE
jgi:hypothetical protein